MAHLVHDVVCHVAVHGPVTRVIGDKFDVARLANGNEYAGFRPPRAFRDFAPVRFSFPKRVAVQMDGVVIHRR